MIHTTTRSDFDTYAHDGILDSIKSYGATVVSILKTRLEILSTELQEEKERLKGYLILGVIAMFCALMGIIFLSLFVVVLFWDTNRVLAVAAVTVAYFIAAAACGLSLKNKVKSHPKLFAATIAELVKDHRHLTQ